jgi:phenylalanyl-tRNA synthetase alpha chain
VDQVRSLLRRAELPLEEDDLTDQEKTVVSLVAKKRGAGSTMFRVVERDEVVYGFAPDAAKVRKLLRSQGMTGEEIGALTPEILQEETWKGSAFRPYNVKTTPARVLLGRRNPYVEFIERLKDKLMSLGFEEFDGPLVETEFWNSDALFMPQFHAARDIHDVFYVKDPTHAREIEQPYLDNVAAAHENGWTTGSRGWRYGFDRDFTRRLILRSQGTVLSAKTLHTAKVPGKYFGVVRCFRPDDVDATHSADFYQTEGIVLGEEVNLRTLLGLLKIFAVEVAGAEEVKFVPGYFPFTEPSVEAHMKHPRLGWMELGGSGIFRPEVTAPMGIDVPVLAWGLGIDRMAMVSMGINDLRDLFTFDIEEVRLRTRR